MSTIINNPTGLDAIQAGRLAQRYDELCQAWRVSLNPDVEDAMLTMQTRRETHYARTGWVAYHDGYTTTYHYTNPAERPQL